MRSFVIKKRTLYITAVILLGIGLLYAGKSGDLLGKTKAFPDQPVSLPVTAEINRMESNGPSLKVKLQENSLKTVQDAGDFFINYRLDREKARGQRVEWLREVINSAGTAGETRQKAQEHLLSISRSQEKEVELENLFRARGYEDAAVQVDDRSVTVVVSASASKPDENIRIADMVSRSTGVDAQNIMIIQKN